MSWLRDLTEELRRVGRDLLGRAEVDLEVQGGELSGGVRIGQRRDRTVLMLVIAVLLGALLARR